MEKHCSSVHLEKLKLTIEVGEYNSFRPIWDKVFKNGPSKICGRRSA